MPKPRAPLQNILWLVGERAGRALVTATVLGVVARHLEPAGFGQLNFAVAVAAIAAALANLGLEGVVVDELIRRPAQAGAVLGTALRLRLAAGLATAALLGGLAALATPADAPVVAIVALGLAFQPADVIDLWFQRHLESRRTAVARLVGICAGATLKLWLAAAGAPLAAFAWAQVADVAFIAAALAWAVRRSPHPTGPWTWDPGLARQLWRRGAPLAVATLAVAFALRLDQLLVRGWLGEHDAGIYFAAVRLVDMILFAGAAMSLSLFPALSASRAASPGEFAARLQAQFDALSALGWIAGLGCTLAGPLVIRLLYGPAYAGAADALAVLGWAALVALNANVRWNFILLAAPVTLNLAAAALHAATLLALAAALLPRLGLAGAAWSLLAANLASGLATSFLFPPLRPCAAAQARGLLILFTPARWRGLLAQFQARPAAAPPPP
ncbi:MAG: oligosaccharide flippase family protein [Opitutaceae bacterium]|nr:oligosaccharide flippase family protein [Opitutaceae bacterium]